MTRARKDEAGTSGAGYLIAGIVCVLLELTILAYAVGTVVPPVGDALGVDVRGIGGLLGYLFGACVFAVPTLLLLIMGIGGDEPLPDEEPAERPVPAIRPPLTLPAGPGLALRWSAAVPLMLLAAFGPLAWAIVLSAWSAVAWGEQLAPFDLGRSAPAFGAELRTSLAQRWPMAFLPVAVLAGFLFRRNRMAPWPTACLMVSGATVGLGTAAAFSPRGDVVPGVPNVVFSAAVVGAAYLLGRLAAYVLSRPVATDVVSSGLEIAYRLPGGRRRLRIQDHGLVLDRLRRWAQGDEIARTSISWQALEDVRSETVPTERRWRPAPGALPIDVPAGAAVRVVADGQDWLVPVRNEQVARTIVTVVALRAHR